ncbi:NACHT domain-containing protein, partial [Salmonella enterica]|nr:NACHT domain-containing protein [Salmonella enterica]
MDFIYQELAKAGIALSVKELFTRVVSAWDKKNLSGKQLVRELTGSDVYLNYLEKHVARVVRLRTIHSADYDILLTNLYHPLGITSLSPGATEHKVNDGFYIENQHITNIIGIAGQGKSTILRKLFIEQIKNGTKIPFFIELRRTGNDGIIKSLENTLINLGLHPTSQAIDELLFSNKISLMLDGFDEVNSKQKDILLSEILMLNVKYALQVIVTSRPGTTVCNEPSIVNYKVEKLKEKDILAIIEKLNTNNGVIDKEQLPKIKDTIKNNKNLVSVMTSPILVTLFHVCYPFMDIIPNNTVEFYSNLFMTLYLRHDKVKNFDREKSSSLSHNEAYDCFCTLCFYSIYTNNHEFTEQSLNEYTEKSMKLKGRFGECKAESLAQDFINVTCLIQREGFNKYIFIHKSIQEYHAAEFIKNISSDQKNKFYSFLVEDIKKNELRFSNVIVFLKEIDVIDCAKFLIIPLCEYFGVSKWNALTPLEYKDLLRTFFSDTYIHLFNDNNERDIMGFSSLSGVSGWMQLLDISGNNDLYTPVFEVLIDESLSSANFKDVVTSQEQKIVKISFMKIIIQLGIEDKIAEVFIKNIQKIHNEVYCEAINKVNNEDVSI